MIDVLYVSFERLEMARESFAALKANTNWRLVDALYVYDDRSGAETYRWLEGEQEVWNSENRRTDLVIFDGDQAGGGPVAAMAHYLDLGRGADAFAKVDNDFVVCPGWLDELVRLAELHPAIDIFGIEPFQGDPTMPPAERVMIPAPHIGGKGLLRKRAFSHCRPVPAGQHGYFGFTEWQVKHPDIVKAWVKPDLPCFGLDQLPFEPWISLTDSYVERGWQRRWPNYAELPREHGAGDWQGADERYWDWWLELHGPGGQFG